MEREKTKMKSDRVIFDGDILKIKTGKRMLKKLEKILEIQILDMKGNLIMNFWRGEKNERKIK